MGIGRWSWPVAWVAAGLAAVACGAVPSSLASDLATESFEPTIARAWRFFPAWKLDDRGVLRPVRDDRLGDCCAEMGPGMAGQLGLDEQLWGGSAGEPGDIASQRQGDIASQRQGDRAGLLTALNRSLGYLGSGRAEAAYRNYPIAGISRERVQASLLRFRDLLNTSQSAAELWAAVRREFTLYQSIGVEGNGRVLFTAYYEPVFAASRRPTAEYRWPLYRRPPDLARWARPHPTREELEGRDGQQGDKGKLKGLAFVWLRDRFEAYLVHVQGSARLSLTDGSTMSVGYAGSVAQDYKSVGRSLADDGKLNLETLRMPDIVNYFRQNPAAMDVYLPRDRSFVFFGPTNGRGATGSIGVELVSDRAIATDKSLMPPGALALIFSEFPFSKPGAVVGTGDRSAMEFRTVSRFVLDQDTGGAIKGPSRVDYFVGSGPGAGDRAGLTKSNGRLYYLLLKP